MTTKRAVLYVRLSESSEESTSIARQEADLRGYAEREGLEVVEVLADDGISGRRSRERAEHALGLLRDGAADVLLVWKFDRWSRQGLGALAALIEVLDARPDARFVALQDGLSSTAPAWRIIASVLAEVARMEAENTAARVRSSIAALRRSGRFSGGVIPYGYRSEPNPDGPGVVLVVDEVEAAVLAEAAGRVLAGQGLGAIAADFNARGIAPRRASAWSRTAIRGALTSDAVVGRVTHRGDLLRDDEGLPLAVWDPALAPGTWQAVRAVLEGRGPVAPPRARRAARLLSGVLFCGSCDRPLYVRVDHGRPSYRCMAKSAGYPCEGVSIGADAVEALVSADFLAMVGRFEVPALVVDEAPEAALHLAEVEEALDRVMAALRDVEDEDEEAALLAQRRSLRARVEDLRATAQAPRVRVVGSGRTYSETWEASTVEARRSLLLGALDSIIVSKGTPGRKYLDPGRLHYQWNPVDTPEDAGETLAG